MTSGDDKGLVVLCDTRAGRIRTRWQYKQKVVALAFSPDSQSIAVGRGREVRLLNAKTGKPVRVFQLQAPAGRNLAFSADGSKLMVLVGRPESERDRQFFVDVWQLPSGKRLRHWAQNTDDSFAAALAPKGQVVAISTTGNVELRSIATGQRLRKWEDKTEKEWPYIDLLAFAPDSASLAGGGGYFEAAGHFAHWNVNGEVQGFASFRDWATALAFSPHNRLLAVGAEYDTVYVDKPRAPGGDVMLYDLKTHKAQVTLKGHKAVVNALAWSPDGRKIASASDDKTVRIWTLVR